MYDRSKHIDTCICVSTLVAQTHVRDFTFVTTFARYGCQLYQTTAESSPVAALDSSFGYIEQARFE